MISKRTDSDMDGIKIPRWLRESLAKKVSKELHEAEMKRLDGEIENLEKGLEKGLDRGHLCDKGKIIEMNTTTSQKNQEGIQKMYKWFARLAATALLVFISSGVAFVWSLATITAKVDMTVHSMDKIDKRHEKSMEALLERTSNNLNNHSSSLNYYPKYLKSPPKEDNQSASTSSPLRVLLQKLLETPKSCFRSKSLLRILRVWQK